jgi:hypothetical protein
MIGIEMIGDEWAHCVAEERRSSLSHSLRRNGPVDNHSIGRRFGSITAQSRRSHGAVTAQSRRSHVWTTPPPRRHHAAPRRGQGLCYEEGNGVPRDPAAAALHVRKRP